MKKIFIAATKQNDGKTTISLGLICNFKDRFKKVSFIKPIGQRYLEEEGQKIDEDSVLIEKVCGIRCRLKDKRNFILLCHRAVNNKSMQRRRV